VELREEKESRVKLKKEERSGIMAKEKVHEDFKMRSLAHLQLSV